MTRALSLARGISFAEPKVETPETTGEVTVTEDGLVETNYDEGAQLACAATCVSCGVARRGCLPTRVSISHAQ